MSILDALDTPELSTYEMTWEQAVLWLRGQPAMQYLARACYFDDPLLGAAQRFANSDEWAAVCSLLPKSPGTVLDLGAGRGIASYALAMAGWTVTSVEPDQSDIVGAGAIRSIVDQTNLPVTVVGAYGRNLPFPEGTFDVVYIREAMHHVPDLRHSLLDVARVLKHGGRLIATREHVLTNAGDLSAFLESHPTHRLCGGENAYVLCDYINAISQAGMKIDRVLAPFESVVNYFPMTEAERMWLCRCQIARLFGERRADRIVHSKGRIARLIIAIALKSLSFSDRTPGRLYSFVADKP